jgi:hypothetical protein
MYLMAFIRLRRHAPEAQSRETCSLCGARRRGDTKDHLLVGTPGTPSHDGAVCDACGTALDQTVRKFGGDLTVTVEESQREASEREITLPDH